jgi:hypothetical protein
LASLTLSYADLRSAISERRFPGSSATAITQWLAAAYADVWNAGNWTFKKVTDAAFYTTTDGLVGGTPTVTPKMPADFASVINLLDDYGDALHEVDQWDFERYYTDPNNSIQLGRPHTFTVVNRQIQLYPKPQSAYLFTLSYERRLSTRTSTGTVQAGFFVLDGDLPLWDDHHYLLVLRARILGLRDRSDPTASDLLQEYAALLDAMRNEYQEQSPVGEQMPAYRGY